MIIYNPMRQGYSLGGIRQPKYYMGALNYRTASKALSEGDWSLAKKEYQKSLNRGFRPSESMIGLAKATDKSCGPIKAIELIKPFIKSNNDNRVVKLLVGYYIEIGYYRKAEKALVKYSLSDSSDVGSLNLLATAYAKQNKMREYIDTLISLVGIENTAHRYNQILFAYGKIGNIEEITKLLDDIIKHKKFTSDQVDRFLVAASTGLTRSFNYEGVIKLYEHFTSLVDLSDRMMIDLAMLYEITGNNKQAEKVYQMTITKHSQYDWWARFRIARIHLNSGRYKSSLEMLRDLFPSSSTIDLPQNIRNIMDNLSNHQSRRYKKMSREVINSLPGWDVSLWVDEDDKIFESHYKSIINLLNSSSDSIATNKVNYLNKSLSLGIRLSERRLWVSAGNLLTLSVGEFKNSDLAPPELAYINLSRCLTNQGHFRDSRKIANGGLLEYPRSLGLKIEIATSFQRQTNVYMSKLTWDKILKEHKPEELNVWNFIAAAEINLLALDHNRHKKIIKIAVDMLGQVDINLSYYIFNSYCTKIINLNTEKRITGDGSFSEHYEYHDTVNNFRKYSKIIANFTYEDEKYHRIRHRYLQVESILMNELWSEGRDMSQELNALFNYLHLDKNDSLIAAIQEIINRSRSDNVNAERIRGLILNTPHHTRSRDDWLIIHQLLLVNKFLHLGYLAREKSLLCATDTNVKISPTHYSLQKRFHAHLEMSNLAMAKETLELIDTHYPQQPFNTQLRNILSILDRNITLRRPKPSEPSDRKYRSLLEDKQVAVVAPAPITENLGAEIDSNDVVIRFNYRGGAPGDEVVRVGSKTSVSYQNGPNLRKYFSKGIPPYMDDVSIYNVEYLITKKLINEVSLGKARNNGVRLQLYSGVMMAVPAVIIDILGYRPKNISLYGVNFYLSSSPYMRSYTKHGDKNRYDKQDIYRLLELVSAHDLISQRRIVNNLKSRGLIDVDSECKRVLDISDEEYMLQMENLFKY